ncbi:hypothetical protein [Paracraurococcus lichenis]|uniref:DUF5666 domain-containing protein n=1 Tax=Paracraurococcus lichenis TaxID=3064888 RepID=A0ABT9E7U6_9PROT|nr:hypothetical protein [Paracraurococcus sp. LOR1-02]MDO9712199.1 hypothetical protein [Paracraurococcus sp. LOR1-02]
MPRLSKPIPLLAALLALSLGGAALVCAQPVPPTFGPTGFDPAQLPETRGVLARYTLTLRGEVDGFLLQDGTQVRVPPHLSTQLVYAVHPGDAVTVRGLRALGAPLVSAVSVARDAGGPPVVDMGGGPRGALRPVDVQGRVQMPLRGPRGEVNGVLLEDGTQVHLPPPEAERFADLFRPGQTLAARGDGLTTPLGTVLEADAIGPGPDRLAEIGRPSRPLRDDRGPGTLPPRPPRG